MIRYAALALIGGIAAGCASVDYSGVSRVTLTRENGRDVRTERPLPVSPSHGAVPAELLERSPARQSEAEVRPEPFPAVYFSTIPIASAGAADDGVGGLRRLRVETRYTRSRIWTGLSTTFRSPSFSNLQWGSRTDTHGWGPEAAVFLTNDWSDDVGVRIGALKGSQQTNFHQEGALFVRETSHTEAYWIDAEYRHAVTRWLFLSVASAGFVYHIDTSIESNAPSFVYDTLTFNRAFGAIGVGAGLQTPWRIPLRLFAATNFWLPYTEGAGRLEWGVGQVSAGAAWRF